MIWTIAGGIILAYFAIPLIAAVVCGLTAALVNRPEPTDKELEAMWERIAEFKAAELQAQAQATPDEHVFRYVYSQKTDRQKYIEESMGL